jgi:sugar phosphate permease
VVTVVVALGLRGAPPLDAKPADGTGPPATADTAPEPGDGDEKDREPKDREPKDQDREPGEPLRALLLRLAQQPAFWMSLTLSFLLTFVRAGFMTWTPFYLYDVARAAGSASALSGSIAKSAFFGVAGMTGSLFIGRISDRWGPGRRAGVMTSSLVFLLGAVLALGHAHVTDALAAAGIVGMAGLFLLGPYSLLGGAITLDIAGKRGASTLAGILDGVGYVGASLAAAVVGSVSKRHGWSAAFDVIAGVTATALAIAAVWWRSTRPRS